MTAKKIEPSKISSEEISQYLKIDTLAVKWWDSDSDEVLRDQKIVMANCEKYIARRGFHAGYMAALESLSPDTERDNLLNKWLGDDDEQESDAADWLAMTQELRHG